MRRIACLTTLCLVLPACLPFGSRDDTAEERVFAPTEVDRSAEAPDDMIVGNRLAAEGEYELARKAYLRAALDRGFDAEVLTALGLVDLRLGRLGQAEDRMRRAVRTDPDYVPALNNLGVVLMEQGKTGEAAEIFRTAFAADSGQSDDIRSNLSAALEKLEDSRYRDPNNEADFALVRRGQGDFLIRETR